MAGKKLSPHFSESEFRCKCGRKECDAVPMKSEFIALLEKLRVKWGKPLSPSSGCRCKWHNKNEKGATRSQHLYGNAVDFYFADSKEKMKFVGLAQEMGFGGIGVGVGKNGKVHLDGRKVKARWTYG